MDASHTLSPAGGRGPLFEHYAGLSLDAEMAAGLGPWRWEADSNRVQLPQRLRTVLGLGPNTLQDTLQDILEAVHPEDRDRVRAELDGAARHRRAFSWQARISQPDGGIRTVLCQGRPSDLAIDDEILAVCVDVSARGGSVLATGRFEHRLSRIISESPAMLTIKDFEHRYRVVNNQVAQLADLTVDDLLGHTATEIFPGIGPEADALAAEARSTGKTIHRDVGLEIAGEMRTFHWITFALPDRAGTPVEICAMATDVTESRRLHERTRRRRQITDLISSALAEDRLVAASQPVVDIRTGAAVSEELLVRLALPDGVGLLQPSSFLPHAEDFGLIQRIDIWMLDRAIEVAASRQVQVNLSAVTLTDPTARVAMIAALERAPEAAGRIVFEITETAVAHHLNAAVSFAEALTELGCGLALDDFGTGFGSFTYLQRLPLRYLKIDQSFVAGLMGSGHDRRVVGSITGIARQFDLETIAEGVDDRDTLNMLGELGADYAQGFHVGRPVSLRELTRTAVAGPTGRP
jgi:PAS domain S-box-containing protein